MTNMRNTSRRCSRAHEWISLRLDDELSELEQALLDAHLACCAACSAFAADATGFTGALRAAQLESLERPVVLPRRRQAGGLIRIGVAAAAVAATAAAGLGAFQLSNSHRGPLISGAERAAALAGRNNLSPVREAARAGLAPRPKIDRITGRGFPSSLI